MEDKRNLNTPSLKINIMLNMAYQILAIITPLITAPYVSRVLQADGVGINSYVTSLLTFFTLFAALGTASYGKKIIAGLRNNKKDYSKAFWEIELITVFTTIVCMIAWVTFSLLYKEYRPYMLVLSFTLLATLFDISWLYGGLEKFQYTVSINSIFKILSVVCIFLFVKSKDDVLVYTAIMSLSTLFGSMSMWLFLPKHVVRPRVEISTLKQHLKSTIIYFGPAIATSIYTVMDKTLIGIITNSNIENGYYEQATKITNIVKAVCFDAINGVMISRASFYYSQNDGISLCKVRDTTYHLISFLSVGACFGIIGVSKVFVPIFFGEGYDSVVLLLDVLAIVIVIIGISSVANTIYFIAGGNMDKAIKLLLIGSFSNLILNIALIPKLGSTGATIATLIAESIITILFIKGTEGFIQWKGIVEIYWKKIFAGVVMLLGIIFVSNLSIGIARASVLTVEIIVGGMVYIIILLLLKDPSIIMAKKFIQEKIKR